MGLETYEWRRIGTAPKDGTRFKAKGPGVRSRRLIRTTWYGKTSHVPLYGWCHGRDVEDIDLWHPTHWKPLPAQGDEV